jgi:DNA repair photolyase
MDFNNYTYYLSVTSQFYFCGLPLRLDSYSKCQFQCLYCFANARGGFRGDGKLGIANADTLRRRLDYLTTNEPRSVIDEFLKQRQPIHFGGMSDPFMPIENKLKITYELLKVLSDFKYPTVISTKGDIFAREPYIEQLKRGNYIIQVSLSSLDCKLLNLIDHKTPGPQQVLGSIRNLKNEGIPIFCRIQPILPTRENDAFEVIEACSTIGIKHIAVEHLKLGFEKSYSIKKLSDILKIDLINYFKTRKSKRVGREWVLHPEYRLGRLLDFKNFTKAFGISFGVADTDLLLLGDSRCCCSGIDLVEGFENYFKYNYTEALRRGLKKTEVRISLIDSSNIPSRPINKFINSNSRIKDNYSIPNLEGYIKMGWNRNENFNSPLSFYGLEDPFCFDDNGYKIYRFSDEMQALLDKK